MTLYTAAAAAVLTSLWLLSAHTAQCMMIEGTQMSMDDAIIKAGSNGSMTKMFEIMQDENTVMVELDMLYPMKKYNDMRKEMTEAESEDEEQGSRKKRKAIIPAAYYRWTNARVPYEISYEFSSADRQLIMSAINDYHKYTCIRFVRASGSDRNRVRFQNGGGCSSYVGMIGGSQPLSLAPGCRYKGIIIHEMGHAIGFQHEQTRPDRNGYVSILTQNILSGLGYNFMQYSRNQVNNFNVPYDYLSVMHYSQYAFSRNGQPTIRARDPNYQTAMGNREGFSFNDIWLANTIYDCANRNSCPKKTCPSNAFQGPDCECWCNSGDRSNPVKACDGNTRVTTERPQVTTTPSTSRTEKPMMCEDKHEYCSYWARSGYCRGSYQAYMMSTCKYSCNYCSRVDPTTTTMATPPIEGCQDESSYCKRWADRGECTRNPSYMERYCKRSCNKCSSTSSSCKDMSSYCKHWTDYCTNDIYKDYLRRNCARTCNRCSAGDVEGQTTPTASTESPGLCMDQRSQNYCSSRKSRCSQSSMVYNSCKKTCGGC